MAEVRESSEIKRDGSSSLSASLKQDESMSMSMSMPNSMMDKSDGVGDFGLRLTDAAVIRERTNIVSIMGRGNKTKKRVSTSIASATAATEVTAIDIDIDIDADSSSRPFKEIKYHHTRTLLDWLENKKDTKEILLAADAGAPPETASSSSSSSQDGAHPSLETLDPQTLEDTSNQIPPVSESTQHSSLQEERRRRKNLSVFGYHLGLNRNNKTHATTKPRSPPPILLQLMRRSIQTCHCINISQSYSECKTVNLRTSMGHSIPTSSSTSSLTHVQFDSEGILLATADSKGQIRIFDFDEVQYQDFYIQQQTQFSCISDFDMNTRQEQYHTKVPIHPTLEFKALSKIYCLKWNPFNQDELALSFTTSSEMRIYDLSTFEEGNCHTPQFIRIAPTQVLSKGQSISYFYFIPQTFISVDGRKNTHYSGQENVLLPSFSSMSSSSSTWLLTAGSRGLLILWRLLPQTGDIKTNSQQRRVQLIWSMHAWKSNQDKFEGISDIVLLNHPSHYVLVAGDKGSIAIIDTSNCTHKTFSTQMTPEIVQHWHLPSSFVALRPCPDSVSYLEMMGIRKVYTDFEHTDQWRLISKQGGQAIQQAQLIYNFTLVTFGGWVFHINIRWTKLENSLLYKTSMSDLEVIHKSRNSKIPLSAEDLGCYELTQNPSLPEFPSPTLLLSKRFLTIAVAHVKQTVSSRSLNIYDCVLVPPIKANETENDAILGISCSGNKYDFNQADFIFKIELPAFPVTMDIHPNHMWIVVGVTDKKSNQSNLLLLKNNR